MTVLEFHYYSNHDHDHDDDLYTTQHQQLMTYNYQNI